MIRYLFLIIFLLLSCTQQKQPIKNDHPQPAKSTRQQFVKVKHLQTIGDFDGDGRKDTVQSHLEDISTHQELDSVPDFDDSVDYDSLVRFYYKVGAYLILSSHTKDTLDLGPGFGPFCLFSIGDSAIVYCEDLPDYSTLNQFDVQYYRKGKWYQLARYDITELGFQVTDTSLLSKPFTNIPGYLEKHDGKWVYRDLYSYDTTLEWFPLILNPPTLLKKQ